MITTFYFSKLNIIRMSEVCVGANVGSGVLPGIELAVEVVWGRHKTSPFLLNQHI